MQNFQHPRHASHFLLCVDFVDSIIWAKSVKGPLPPTLEGQGSHGHPPFSSPQHELRRWPKSGSKIGRNREVGIFPRADRRGVPHYGVWPLGNTATPSQDPNSVVPPQIHPLILKHPVRRKGTHVFSHIQAVLQQISSSHTITNIRHQCDGFCFTRIGFCVE
jgi:hypothetical protein